MGKYRHLVDTLGGLAEFRKDYNIPDDVHLILAEKDIFLGTMKALSPSPSYP